VRADRRHRRGGVHRCPRKGSPPTAQIQRDLLPRELGDLLWRVGTLATAAGLDLGEVAAGGLAAVEDLYGTGMDEAR